MFTNTCLRICVLFTPTPCRYPRPLFRRVRQPQPADSVRSSDSIKRSWRHQRAPLLTQRLRVRWGRLQRIIGKLQFLLAVIGQERCCPDLLLFRTSFLAPCIPHAVVVHLLPRATCRMRGRCFPLRSDCFHVIRNLRWCHGPPFSAVFRVALGGSCFGHDIL